MVIFGVNVVYLGNLISICWCLVVFCKGLHFIGRNFWVILCCGEMRGFNKELLGTARWLGRASKSVDF